MRTLGTEVIGRAVEEALLEMAFVLPADVKETLQKQRDLETSEVGRGILERIVENSEIAPVKRIPLCQDTGMVVVFLEVGQEVSLEGPYIETVIQNAVAGAYEKGYLRKSTVGPLTRQNRLDNTPAVIHYRIVPGESVRLEIAAKGFGSENMSRLRMLKPSEGIEGVKQFVLEAVRDAGPNPCPPIVVGIGIGGTVEKAAMMAKHALMRELGSLSKDPQARELETELLESINKLGIGPMGMGGITTALGVFVELYPTHIAGLPVVVNINCHSSRHREVIL